QQRDVRRLPQASLNLETSPGHQPLGHWSRRIESAAPAVPGSVGIARHRASVLENIVVAVVTVLPRTDVSLRIERLTTQRARLASGTEHTVRPRGEGSRLRGTQEHPHRVGPLLRVVEDDGLVDLPV